MDPIAHTFAGAALAKTQLGRTTPLATTTLIIAANVPDVDAVVAFGGEAADLALRRGLTHGLFAVPFLAAAVAGGVWIFDRHVRRRRRPDAPPARAGPLFGLALLGVLTHPILDWMNTYGMRWFLPFDNRWSYGDALFILDPWLWLGLGGLLFLAHSRRWWSLSGWVVLWLLMSALILLSEPPPLWARVLWVAGSAGFAWARWRRWGASEPGLERAATGGVALAAAYVVVMVGLGAAAARVAEGEITRGEAGDLAAGRTITEVMVGPEPANALAGHVVAVTDDAYLRGTFRWTRRPRTRLDEMIPKVRADATLTPEAVDAAVAAARRTEPGGNYLVWSRYPFFEIVPGGDGLRVRIGDARFAGRATRLGEMVVRVPPEP